MENKLKVVAKRITDIIYPATCPLCKEILKPGETGVCRSCKAGVDYVKPPCCMKCGKEMSSSEQEYCRDCREQKRSFIKGFPAMLYTEAVADSIAEFKYNNMRSYGEYFAREIVKTRGREILDISPEVIVPVPVHKAKLSKRGYNQAEILGTHLGRLLDIPVDNRLLIRGINTAPQKTLDNLEREKNLKKAFNCVDKIVEYKRVLLVDDIYTTGATIEACTCALMNKGVETVYYTSICIGKGC